MLKKWLTNWKPDSLTTSRGTSKWNSQGLIQFERGGFSFHKTKKKPEQISIFHTMEGGERDPENGLVSIYSVLNVCLQLNHVSVNT